MHPRVHAAVAPPAPGARPPHRTSIRSYERVLRFHPSIKKGEGLLQRQKRRAGSLERGAQEL